MKSIHFTRTEWALLLCSIVALVFVLSGCGRGAVQPGDAEAVQRGPAQILSRIAVIATAVAGAALVACGFLAVFYHDKFLVAKLAIACVATVICAQVTYQFGNHLGAISLGALVVAIAAAGFLAWRHLGKIEKRLDIDLNGDGSIGRLKPEPMTDRTVT
jgi:hypothetical protein